MAREIKFRAKNVMNGEWVCGDLVHYNHSHTHISIAEKECKEQYFVHPETVCQFIGIKDNRGREIYEGDILEYYNDITKKSHVSGHVVYDEYKAAFNIVNPEDGRHLYIMPTDDGIEPHLNIIGNIHDNPELLKWTRKLQKTSSIN